MSDTADVSVFLRELLAAIVPGATPPPVSAPPAATPDAAAPVMLDRVASLMVLGEVDALLLRLIAGMAYVQFEGPLNQSQQARLRWCFTVVQGLRALFEAECTRIAATAPVDPMPTDVPQGV